MHSVCDLLEQGLQVNMCALRKEASRLLQNFKDKMTITKISSVNHFNKKLVSLNISLYAHCTKEPQRDRGGVIAFNVFDETESHRDGGR